MDTLLRIAVIMGGYSEEREISLKSAAQVQKHLDPSKYETYLIDIRKDGWFYTCDSITYPLDKNDFSLLLNDKRIHFDVVFNAIHGTPGEDGQLLAYFELLGIPYTGSSSYISALSFNKRDLLSVTSDLSIPRARHIRLNKHQTIPVDRIETRLGYPCFVKANRSGSSFGVYKVSNASQLTEAVNAVFDMNDELIIEEALLGEEVTVGVIRINKEAVVLPMTLIKTGHDFFNYEAKYQGESEELTPAPIEESLRQLVSEYALRIYTELNFNGATRSEFILKEGEAYLLEVNTTPGLTEQSILPQQAAAAGISMRQLFELLIIDALNRDTR